MANAAWYLLVACIPLGTRAFLGLASPALPEYTSLFVYATDLLVLFIVSRAVIFRSQPARLGWESLFLKGFVVSAVLSIFLSTVPALAFYQTIRLILFVCFASLLATFFSLKKTFQAVLAWIGAAALVESILAISQFVSGKSLGLYFFGESPISPTLAGVGKITIGGLRFVRGYGTFPHPNVLAAFLFLGLLAISYLYSEHDKLLYRFNWRYSVKINYKKFKTNPSLVARLALAACLWIVILALLLTFSRAGWLSACIGVLVFLTLLYQKNAHATLRLLFVLFAATVTALALIAPFVCARFDSVRADSPAFIERILYNGIGVHLLTEHPLGVGLSHQALTALRGGLFHGLGLSMPWQWQPIHNMYLLMATEIGVLGLFCFFVFCGALIRRALKDEVSAERAVALSMFVGLLIFGLFDHFLWDIQAGALMLWVSIGLLLSQVALSKASQVQ